MKEALKIPQFKSETEEAAWYPQQEDAIMQAFEGARAAGQLRRRGSQAITLRMDLEDLELARKQAATRGLPYQSYVKMLLHMALAREAEQPRL